MAQQSFFHFTAQYALYQKGNGCRSNKIQKQIPHFTTLSVKNFDEYHFRDILYKNNNLHNRYIKAEKGSRHFQIHKCYLYIISAMITGFLSVRDYSHITPDNIIVYLWVVARTIYFLKQHFDSFKKQMVVVIHLFFCIIEFR